MRLLHVSLPLALLVACVIQPLARAALQSGEVHTWETQEITFESTHDYHNPYTDVICWIQLEGNRVRR